MNARAVIITYGEYVTISRLPWDAVLVLIVDRQAR